MHSGYNNCAKAAVWITLQVKNSLIVQYSTQEHVENLETYCHGLYIDKDIDTAQFFGVF